MAIFVSLISQPIAFSKLGGDASSTFVSSVTRKPGVVFVSVPSEQPARPRRRSDPRESSVRRFIGKRSR
jgi:hypothetical protein